MDILYTIIKEAEQFGNVFLPLITTAYECLIDHYSAIKDIAGVEHTYVESVKYQNDDIGKLQLNFALASAYMNFDRFDDALEAIAEKAMEKDTGARALRAIIEEFMLDIMYEIPKDDSIGTVVITKDYVENNGAPRIILRNSGAIPEN